MESQFTSSFWHWYIVAIVVASFIFVIWVLLSQDKVKPLKKGEEVKTTGHAWDGIEEYNNGLPRWWFWLFVSTILFGIAYLFAYPGLGDYRGWKFAEGHWSSKNQYEQEMKAAEQEVAPLYAKYAGMPVEQVAKDADAMKIGQNLFNTYCIQCHGSDAQGSRGFPNLTDTDWLYGGTADHIRESIEKGRLGVMQPWGPTLGEERVKDAANYVMSLSGKEHNEDRALRGKEVFAANCAVCHGEDGGGKQATAPNLTDDVWLWGGSEKAIIETITGGRHNQMPAWGGFLSKEKIHMLTAYVWGKSHPDGKGLPTDTQNAVRGKAPTTDGNAAAKSASDKAQTAASVSSAPVVAAASPAASASAVSAPAQTKSVSEVAVAEKEKPAEAVAPAADKAEVKLENGVLKFYFATARSDVAPEAVTVAAEAVKAAKAGKKLVVSGFADSTGNAAANARLSKRRAEAVRAFLVKQGVKAENIELRKPENSTGAQGNNAEGRRVEVKIEG